MDFIGHVLRAQRLSSQAPDNHVLQGGLTRPVESADQRHVSLDIEHKILRVFAADATMSVQAAEAMRFNAP